MVIEHVIGQLEHIKYMFERAAEAEASTLPSTAEFANECAMRALNNIDYLD